MQQHGLSKEYGEALTNKGERIDSSVARAIREAVSKHEADDVEEGYQTPPYDEGICEVCKGAKPGTHAYATMEETGIGPCECNETAGFDQAEKEERDPEETESKEEKVILLPKDQCEECEWCGHPPHLACPRLAQGDKSGRRQCRSHKKIARIEAETRKVDCTTPHQATEKTIEFPQ